MLATISSDDRQTYERAVQEVREVKQSENTNTQNTYEYSLTH